MSHMRRVAFARAAAVLLVGPGVLAFFAGGYFDGPRLVATLIAWALVLLCALASSHPLPSMWPGRTAVAGLSLIAVWTAVSFVWAPLAGVVTDNLIRTMLYLGTLIAAIALLRQRGAARAVEPTLALAALAALAYGLAGRLLPSKLELLSSWKGGGRLEQPITYWNAEGALAAMGLVLCARLAGDVSRPVWMRALASSGAATLGLGLYLTYSRGAIAAALVGLVVLVAAAPSWPQVRAVALALGTTVVLAACAAALPGVASVQGTLTQRQEDGWVMLGLLATVVIFSSALGAAIAVAEARGRLRTTACAAARRLPRLAVAVMAIGLVGLVASGLAERSEPSEGRGAERLTSVDSRRYDYWRVATTAFAENPLRGVGSGGFRVVWLRERPVAEGVLEAHSLPLEMAVELGLPGLLGLGLFLVGSATAARRALRTRPAAAAGPVAAATVWLLHSTIDWDWQLPAVTLLAVILAGALIAAAESRPKPGRPEPAGRARPLRGERAGVPV